MNEVPHDSVVKTKDIFRDTPVRLLGYANEVGEAFRSIISSKLVIASYGIATAYVIADTGSKTINVYNDKNIDNHLQFKKTVYIAVDTFVWQMLASVVIPGFTINRSCALATFVLTKNQLFSKNVRMWVVTGIGLAIIPFIIKPIDSLVDDSMDLTLRKLKP